MNVFVLIPTALAAHAAGTFEKWRAKGYKIGLFTDPVTAGGKELGFSPDLLIHGNYPGVWRAWNALAKAAVACGADVCVLVGDDMEPDPVLSAEEIGRQYLGRFPDGMGIMQPTGDRQGEIIDGKWNSQRICGSPWMGKGWITRAYKGLGPVNPNYTAFYADEEIQIVAGSINVLWQREDITQKHLHWSWNHLCQQPYHRRNQTYWDEDKRLFEEQRKAGFPDARPLS